MERAVSDDGIFSTDVLEYLIRKKMPFAEAHETVGRIVRYSQDSGIAMRDLPLGVWMKFSKLFEAGIFKIFDPLTSVSAKKTIGSTQPAMVKAQIKKWNQKLKLRG
jgi:argininosuccinate lyase